MRATITLTLLGLATFQYTAEATLVIHWKLDEASGTTAADSAGFANTGTLNRGPSATGSWQPGAGIIGGAYDFGGGDNNETIYYSHASAQNLPITDPSVAPVTRIPTGATTTFSAWIRTTQNTFSSIVALNERNDPQTVAANANNYQAMAVDAGVAKAIKGQNATNTRTDVTGDQAINDGQWRHVVTVFRLDSTSPVSGVREVYIDGMLDESAAEDRIGVFPRVFSVGGRVTGRPDQASRYIEEFDGMVDDVGLWDEALAATRIAAIHGLGRLQQVHLGSSAIDDVLGIFAAQGGSTSVMGVTWEYTTGLSGARGAIGGSIAGNNAYIVLGADGSGVQVQIPEPASVVVGLVAIPMMLRRARR